MFRNFNAFLNTLSRPQVQVDSKENELKMLKREIRGRLNNIQHDYEQEVRYIRNNFSAHVATREIERLNIKTQRSVLRLQAECKQRIQEIENRYENHNRRQVANRNVAYISDDKGNDFVINFDDGVDYSGIDWRRDNGGYYHDGSWLTMW